MGIEKKVYSFRLDQSLVEKMKIYAERDNRTISNFVETIIKLYISKLEKEERKQ